jgi:hypothetical protein
VPTLQTCQAIKFTQDMALSNTAGHFTYSLNSTTEKCDVELLLQTFMWGVLSSNSSLAILTKVFNNLPHPFHTNATMTASLQILSNSLFTMTPSILYFMILIGS